ncbi:hypothetical protein FEM48_Zijuj11G0152700 [Ziziphus jujuba var. spinosa]|uniref:Cytochrome P450 71A1-like n=1 Tax=Ziziphus jujuba var. spinosa TaxID=714518 RepID=A0A978UJP7_ZIZJJ|nr:hypothetical protein FEM48_Zijuj11G0152700 [Ziziphus jujuba var. spinosa]
MDNFSPQSFSLSLLLLASFLFCIFRLRKWSTSTGHSPSQPYRLPPSPTALPIIGHLHLLTDEPHITFAQLAQKLGPIIHLQLGQVPTVIVSSSRLARLVLKTHDHVFATRPQLISAQYLSFGCSDVSFSPNGPYWRQARKICVTELLSSKRVKSFQLVRDEEVNRMLDLIRNQSGSKLNLSRVFFSLANDILCRVAFGKRFGNNGDLLDVLTETNVLIAGFCIGDFFPEWKWINSVTGMKKSILRVIGLDCFPPSKPIMMIDMFEGGTDTTSAILEWTMIELVRHPKVMKNAQEEVRKVASETGKVNETHLQHLHYMKAVVKETMRLHPPAPLLAPRESMDKCILDGFEIPAKTRVVINAFAIGMDPKSWEDPLVYNPERFIDDQDNKNDSVVDKDQEFKFVPFGGGRRGCPGFAFGFATIELALARLLYHFDWELPPEVLGPHDVDLDEIFGLASRKKSTLVLVPTTNKDFPVVHI